MEWTASFLEESLSVKVRVTGDKIEKMTFATMRDYVGDDRR